MVFEYVFDPPIRQLTRVAGPPYFSRPLRPISGSFLVGVSGTARTMPCRCCRMDGSYRISFQASAIGNTEAMVKGRQGACRPPQICRKARDSDLRFRTCGAIRHVSLAPASDLPYFDVLREIRRPDRFLFRLSPYAFSWVVHYLHLVIVACHLSHPR